MSTDLLPSLIRGTAELESTDRGIRPHRLPAWVRQQFPDGQLLAMESQPSGVRLEFRTAAQRLELVLHPTRLAYRGADRPRGHVDLMLDGALVASEPLTGGDAIEADLQTGESAFHAGEAHHAVFDGLPSGDKLMELWLPHNESVEIVSLLADAPIRDTERDRPLWVHHGSSISHGSNATSPTRIWPAVAARAADVELRNLGFGGSAFADPFMARVMRDSPADLISVKLGINIVNLDAMRLRTLVPAVHGFLDTIRDGHPETPIVLISPIFAEIHEETPGPGAVDPASLGTGAVRFTATGERGDERYGRLTLRVVRDALASLAERRGDDPALTYLDGTRLYGAEDTVTHPLPDALHPDTGTHQLIGERFAAFAFGAGGPFAAPPGR